MENEKLLSNLKFAYNDFCQCILALPDALLLSDMGGWSPRDVTAHLTGWTRHMIEASSAILHGRTPAYYADASNDYRNINAQMVVTFSSRSKEELLAEMESSMQTFRQFIASLQPEELADSHGVLHHSGRPATIAGIIESLTQDYQHHALEIQQWHENL